MVFENQQPQHIIRIDVIIYQTHNIISIRFMTLPPQTPTTIAELNNSLSNIAGETLLELSNSMGVEVPKNLMSNKGWVGQLIECALGADAGNAAEPDFTKLGIELKTIPVNADGKVLESTYLTLAKYVPGETWVTSSAYKKTRQICWVPVLSTQGIPLKERLVGNGFVWSPSETDEKRLRDDYDTLMELLALGKYGSVNSKLGDVLQLRPKAANGSVRHHGLSEDGEQVLVQPKGFYLRTSFTQGLIDEYFCLCR